MFSEKPYYPTIRGKEENISQMVAKTMLNCAETPGKCVLGKIK